MKKILLVDDDALVVELYRKKLAQAGFEVATAPDGLLAIKALTAAAPDLMVLDLMMPRLSGEDVLKFMGTKPALAAVPVVLLTNSFISEQARAAAPFKISRAITKGESTPAKVLEIVSQLLGVTVDVPPVSAAPAATTAPSAVPDTSLVNDEAREHFLKIAPASLTDLRDVSEEFAMDPVAASRSGNLAEFYKQTHHLAGAASLARCTNVALMGGALEALLHELSEKPQFINPSTARTVAASVDFLGVLIEDARNARRPEAQTREVLVVDDDPLANRIALSALSRANLNGQATENPLAALELLAQKRFDLVLLDVEMPNLSGFELCRKLRLLAGYEKTPVIYVTAHSDFESRSRSILSGGNDLIAKPIFPIELAVKAVTHLIRSRQPSPTALPA
jgi:CheY-like chemotaxis protein